MNLDTLSPSAARMARTKLTAKRITSETRPVKKSVLTAARMTVSKPKPAPSRSTGGYAVKKTLRVPPQDVDAVVAPPNLDLAAPGPRRSSRLVEEPAPMAVVHVPPAPIVSSRVPFWTSNLIPFKEWCGKCHDSPVSGEELVQCTVCLGFQCTGCTIFLRPPSTITFICKQCWATNKSTRDRPYLVSTLQVLRSSCR